MPSRNVIKQYVENGYYHIYNRGVEKRLLFQDQQDYSVFLGYLKEYLLPKDEDFLLEKLASSNTPREEKQKILKLLRLNNFSGSVTLLAYCLMPNHFHFLIKQTTSSAIDQLMNSIGTRYTMYFNRKYTRVGRLYQDVYKAVSVFGDEYLLHLSKYIHKQALGVQGDPLNIQSCSYENYMGTKDSAWVKPDEILSFFSRRAPNQDYELFVQEQDDYELLLGLTLDEY